MYVCMYAALTIQYRYDTWLGRVPTTEEEENGGGQKGKVVWVPDIEQGGRRKEGITFLCTKPQRKCVLYCACITAVRICKWNFLIG